jgi:hypothetical protein
MRDCIVSFIRTKFTKLKHSLTLLGVLYVSKGEKEMFNCNKEVQQNQVEPSSTLTSQQVEWQGLVAEIISFVYPPYNSNKYKRYDKTAIKLVIPLVIFLIFLV